MPKLAKLRSLPAIVIVSLVFCIVALYLGSRDSQALIGPRADVVAGRMSLTPAGHLVIDTSTGLPAVGPLTMNFVRTPDTAGPDGKGRYLIAVNSGFGLRFTSKSKEQQTLSVIDLNLKPEPKVVQNIYFPTPQSANFGLAFDHNLQPDGKYRLFLAGGYENKIWILAFDPSAALPLSSSRIEKDRANKLTPARIDTVRLPL